MWEKAYVDSSLSPYKLKTFVKTRYIEIFHHFVFFHMLDFFLSFFVCVFLPMAHLLYVQMDFFTHGNCFLKLTRD